MRPRGAMVGLLLLLAGACAVKAEGPPHIAVDRTACSHCGMLISEPLYAAAYQVRGAGPRVFDDIGCLLDALGPDPDGSRAAHIRFWFHDAGDGVWIDGTPAAFVTSPQIRTPMGGGILAFRERAAAQHAASTHRGDIVEALPELIARRGGTK